MLPRTPIHASGQNRSLLLYYQRQGYGHPNLHKDLRLMSNPSRDFPIYKSRYTTNHIMSTEKWVGSSSQSTISSQPKIGIQFTINYITSKTTIAYPVDNSLHHVKRQLCIYTTKSQATKGNFTHQILTVCLFAYFLPNIT